MEALDEIIALAAEMPARRSLDELLQLIVDRTAIILGVGRVSVRLLDPTRTQLLAVARAGQSLHAQPAVFRVGEGLLGWIVEHNRPLRLAEPERDPRYAPRDGMVAAMGAFVGVPIRTGEHCTGVLSALDDAAPFDANHERMLSLIAAMCGPYVEIARLSRLSRVDPLTGSLNRRGLDESFPEVAAGPDGDPARPLSVVMIDLDHFKQLNDTHGHAVGDLVLRHVTDIIAGVLRAGDAVVRYGGEEFLLILPAVGCERAARVAERARHAVEARPLVVGGAPIAVTISLGVAERRPDETRDQVVARADAALYRAKRDGRNRVAS